MPNDSEIWQKISGGDPAAFDLFYRENAPRLRAFLRQIVGNQQAAEDVSQEVFTQMWYRPNGFQPERGSLRTYLYGIGRKRAAEWWRKQRPSGQISEEATDNKACVSESESHSIMNDALLRLPEEQRTLLWLREVEGQSYAELAIILEIPIGTVRSRLFTARESLRKIWHSKREP